MPNIPTQDSPTFDAQAQSCTPFYHRGGKSGPDGDVTWVVTLRYASLKDCATAMRKIGIAGERLDV